MTTQNWFKDRKVVILGLARQGQALARFLAEQQARVVVSDRAGADALAAEMAALADLPVEFALDGHPDTLLDDCDLLCLSGGVPPQLPIVQEALAQGIPLSNDSLLTVQLARARGLGPVITVTGSSGKTTTTTLVGEMLRQAGLTVHVGGNIGTPLIDRLDQIDVGEPLVMELSSFQLELFDAALSWGNFTEIGPDVAVLLNMTPNHLDRHATMADYVAAKLKLFDHLPEVATVILSADDAATARLLGSAETPALPAAWQLEPLLERYATVLQAEGIRRLGFSRARTLRDGAWVDGERLLLDGALICRREEVQLRGVHNISNLLAAALVSQAAGADLAAIGRTARTFSGVAHRLEVVVRHAGVTWINDSIATSPERAIAALRSFKSNGVTLILLAGGKDKNLPWQEFADEVIDRVNMLIGFGDAGPMIVRTVQERAAATQRKAPGCALVQRLDEAVDLARRVAVEPSVVLLSPGGTSYDAYRDFEARGEHFRALVQATTEQSVQQV